MKKTMKQFQNWWRRQDASTAKEVLAKEAGTTGKYLFFLSFFALVFPAKLVEAVISKKLEVELNGLLEVGDGKIAAYMLASSMVCFAVSFVLSLKPKTQAQAQSKPKKKS